MKALQASCAIELRGLCKSYTGKQGRYPVLENVSFSIGRGEFVSLIGPSGGGKSTLLNLMAGLERPDAGEVFVQGQSPGDAPAVAYMQQKDLLLAWRTLWDNVLLGPELMSRAHRREMEPAAEAMLCRFGLEGFRHAYPAQLSGGMRQRAALMRTLLCERELMLLDEPFGALDAITRRKLQGMLLEVWKAYGKTVLLVTHDVEEALLLSHRVVVLSSRPGQVRREIAIPLPHAERARSPETLRLKLHLLDLLEDDEAGT